MTADEAAALIVNGSTIGMSGFTGSGHPKEVPRALARRIGEAHGRGAPFTVSIWTGASTGPDLDGALAAVDGIDLRLPYMSDPMSRAKINAGEMEYLDLHLSHVAQMAWEGFFGHLDMAVIEVSGITPDGALIPSSSVGNNKTWLELADKVILEVNVWQSEELEGMHDIYYGTALPPNRKPIPILRPDDRIGQPYLLCPHEKIAAVVRTDSPDRHTQFKATDDDSARIAEHVVEFLANEVEKGRLPPTLLPLQSGVGNVANAVLAELDKGPFRPLTAYTEVIQDGMLQMLRSGTMASASATAFSLSDAAMSSCGRTSTFTGADRPALPGDKQPSGGHSSTWLPRNERDDRSGHLRQCELDAYHGLQHPKWDRRIGRFRSKCVHLVVRHAVDGEGRDHLSYCPDGQSCRPHRARCTRHCHRTGRSGPTGIGAPASCPTDHRALCPSGLSGSAISTTLTGLWAPGSTRPTYSTKHFRGTHASCAMGPCIWTESFGENRRHVHLTEEVETGGAAARTALPDPMQRHL